MGWFTFVLFLIAAVCSWIADDQRNAKLKEEARRRDAEAFVIAFLVEIGIAIAQEIKIAPPGIVTIETYATSANDPENFMPGFHIVAKFTVPDTHPCDHIVKISLNLLGPGDFRIHLCKRWGLGSATYEFKPDDLFELVTLAKEAIGAALHQASA